MSLPRAPGAVVFDLDGLLIDSERLIRDAMIAVGPRFGKPIDLAFFLTLIGHNRAHNDVELMRHFGDGFALEEFHQAVREHVQAEAAAGAALKAGVIELLDALDDADLPRGIATSSSHEWVERHLTAHALTARFNAVVARGDYTNAKPHPEPYLTAARQLGVEPAFCIALEDSYSGVTAAHAAGMMTIMVPDLLAPTDDMRERALRIVDTLHDVRDLIEKGRA
ncbi:MAG: HAD family hydrolase [Hyphomonadaceae bacterium]